MDNPTYLSLDAIDALTGLLLEALASHVLTAEQALAELIAETEYGTTLTSDQALAVIVAAAEAGTTLTADEALAVVIANAEATALSGNPVSVNILDQWTIPSIDAPNSSFILTSRAISKLGLIGQYTGNVSFPYQKRSLNDLLPYPFVIALPYPTTYVLVATYLQEHFGILLEDGEMSVDNNSILGGLLSTDSIDAPPDPTTGHVTMRATAQSGRFTTGSTLALRFTGPGIQVPLSTVLGLDSGLSFFDLTDHF